MALKDRISDIDSLRESKEVRFRSIRDSDDRFSRGRVSNRESQLDRLFDRMGQNEGFFGTLSTSVLGRVSGDEIARTFGWQSQEMGGKRKDQLKGLCLAVGAVHIRHSLLSDDFFEPVTDAMEDLLDERNSNFDRKYRPQSKAGDRKLMADILAPKYLALCGGLYMHDLMHAITNSYFANDIRASFLEPGIQQENNPQLIREEFPTYMFNIGNQVLTVAALLNPTLAAKKAKELRALVNNKGAPAGLRATAKRRLPLFEEAAKGKPTFDRFYEMFFEDAFHFLRNAQLDATEKRERARGNRLGQDINVQRTVTNQQYTAIFNKERDNADPRIRKFLRRIYDSKDVSLTLWNFFEEMTKDLEYNLESKGIVDIR